MYRDGFLPKNSYTVETRWRRSCAGRLLTMSISPAVESRINALVKEAEEGGLVRCMSNLMPILKQLSFSQMYKIYNVSICKLFIVGFQFEDVYMPYFPVCFSCKKDMHMAGPLGSLLELRQENLAWNLRIDPTFVHTHKCNRDGQGLSSAEVHSLCSDSWVDILF